MELPPPKINLTEVPQPVVFSKHQDPFQQTSDVRNFPELYNISDQPLRTKSPTSSETKNSDNVFDRIVNTEQGRELLRSIFGDMSRNEQRRFFALFAEQHNLNDDELESIFESFNRQSRLGFTPVYSNGDFYIRNNNPQTLVNEQNYVNLGLSLIDGDFGFSIRFGTSSQRTLWIPLR